MTSSAPRVRANTARRKLAYELLVAAARAAGLLPQGKLYAADWEALVAAVEGGVLKVMIVPAETGEEVE